MRIRLILGEQILALQIKLPDKYPEQPLSFIYGNLKNVPES